jgi:hypothetical protein
MAATRTRRSRVAAIAVLVTFGAIGAPHANAGTWNVVAATDATGLAHSLAPQPPDTVTATCTAPLTDRNIDVSWTAVNPATSYVVYRSTTSATDGFTAIATGITSTTWTDSALKKATYWYAVATVVGAPTWISPMSGPTAARTIGTTPRCS